MALIPLTQGFYTFSSATGLGDNTYVLGDVSDGFVGTYSIQIVERVAGTCTFDVQARSRGALGMTTAQPPFVAIPYLPLHLNGSVATYGTGASTQITTDSLILVPATGLQVALLVNWTDGEFDLYIQRLIGASA